MKRCQLTLISLLLCLSATIAQQNLYIEGGYAFTTFDSYKVFQSNSFQENYSTSYSNGWQIGVGTNWALTKKSFLKSFIQLKLRGTDFTEKSWRGNQYRNIQLLYLSIPLHYTYKWKLSEQSYLLTGAGGYIAYGIYGTEVGMGNTSTSEWGIENRVMFGNKNEDQVLPSIIKPLDIGWDLVLGAQVKKVYSTVSFSKGVRSVFANSEWYGRSYRNQAIALNLGYMLF